MLKSIAEALIGLKEACRVFSSAFLRYGRYRYPITVNRVSAITAYSQSKKRSVKLLSLFATSQAFTIFRKKEPSEPSKEPIAVKAVENLLSEADELYNENKFNELLELLYPHKDSDNVEILWRLSRVMYNISKQESSKEERKQLIFKAYELIDQALKLQESHYAVHKWYSILLDARASYDGIKSRVKELENVKKHMMRAIELNPKDATTLHMLGFWCFNIAAMPWYQRKIASTIFAAPPESSYEEALFFFNKAEEVDPNFYSQNLLMLGKTYMQLKKEEKARYYLRLAYDYPARTDDDLQARKEAAELLKNLGE